ncbi:hypothetical protein OG936_19030 [Streptomyces sp. NBC_00846]|uniref:hypothetical protein n=1 Tax=Streptomyces sp. NBC_00846 TaxID=2975849 RepID=UPI00386E4187|nr:hypothetical protein OG936_19030 [Streptomyces sp. NBC_00846]
MSMIAGAAEAHEVDALPQERGDRCAPRTGFDPCAPTPYRWFRFSPRRGRPGTRGDRDARPRAVARRPPTGRRFPRLGTPRGRGPEVSRAEAGGAGGAAGSKENQAYGPQPSRSSRATPTGTAKAAPARQMETR